VGTFIGERLLYFPSVGYCVLAADLLGWAWEGLQRAAGAQPSSGARAGGAAQTLGRARRVAARGAQAALALALVAGLALAVGKTWLRNEEWATEDALFMAAERVGGTGWQP
jgi:hypothetical protein